MTQSQQLLAEYAANGSEAAFRELVDRYINLVYSTALRLVDGNAHTAEDVTQAVFVHFARKAGELKRESFIGGWLHRDTCYEASKTMRRERRRKTREEEAAFMNSLTDHAETNLAAIAPLLDEAINLLGAEDRSAILLRFFEQRDFRAVGAALGSNEDAARMRVNRALDKLHALLRRRGVTVPAAALGTALSAEAVSAAPAGLAATVSGYALAASAAATGISATVLKIMTITKLKAGIAGAVVVAGVATSLVIQTLASARQREQDTTSRLQSQELASLATENARLSSLLSQTKNDIATDDPGELAKLRSEADSLRKQTAGMAALREQNRQIAAQKSKTAAGPKTLLQNKEENMDRLNYSKRWQLAFILYASDHGGNYPTNFEQASSTFSKDTKVGEAFVPDEFEIVFQGSQDTIKNPANTIVLREKVARQAPDGRWQKAYGYADGHAEIHTDANGDFDAYEKERIIARTAQ